MTNSTNPFKKKRPTWIPTFTGQKFDFKIMDPNTIRILDIAHGLSNCCRFAGQCPGNYNVAQHSVHVSQIVPAEFALAGLLHDATEAYIGDLVSPLKGEIPEFCAFEDRLWGVIADKFKIPRELPEEVHHADLLMLALEARDVYGADPQEWGLKTPPPSFKVVPWDHETSEQRFMDRFRELYYAYGRATFNAQMSAGVL